ncbi:hypothetical protein LC605_22180 [Nostoc sp. CHAB 5836]|nr:hypothetical protein [Nostoc sp. CHAB 5836]
MAASLLSAEISASTCDRNVYDGLRQFSSRNIPQTFILVYWTIQFS